MSTAEAYYREVKGLNVEESPILGREHHEVIELLEDYHRGMMQVKNHGVSHSVSDRISKVDLEDFADQFINDRYRSLDHTIWMNEMESDRRLFMEGMKRIYYDR